MKTIVALCIVALGAPLGSSLFGLYDRIEHWGKLVHAVDGFCAAMVFGLLFLGWRQAARIDLTDELAALISMFFGILVGVLWEIVEFIRDWVAYSDLEKSNSDTMTDFLCNDVAAIVAALVAVNVYCRFATIEQRRELGHGAELLVDGPSRLLNRHGFAMTIVTAVLIGAAVASLWFSGRPVPGIPIP